MELQTEQTPEIEIIEKEDISVGLLSKVILYNDEWHSFDEVIMQIIKAIGCSFKDAQDKAFETHVKGLSTVYTGEFKESLRVSSVLEEIALHTQIVT
ncbi:MAG: ATP-dependent Clp protease adaptor ClpS [Bacteroidetes bacterium]|nr:ATP-dependent Clp protease adaptor ClpS [Bacteroidota bacterium]